MESQQIENILTALIMGGTFVFIAFSPIARAIGHRIMHGRIPAPGTTPLPDPRVDDVLDDNAMLRRQLEEVQERMEFTERMLAKVRDQGALPAPKDG